MSIRDTAEPATVQVIAPDGTPTGEADVGLDEVALRELLRLMVRCRRLDRECMALQRQGELTVYPPFEGQEAAQVGSAFALGPDDFVFPSFRELAAAVVRGVDAVEYLQYHRGTWHGGPYDPLANRFGPICVPVATQIVHAVGWALGAKLDGRPDCALAYFGDGSASEGDFHEAANLASVFGVPAILFCQNNAWAIDARSGRQIWRYRRNLPDQLSGTKLQAQVQLHDCLADHHCSDQGQQDGQDTGEQVAQRSAAQEQHASQDTGWRDDPNVESVCHQRDMRP